MISRRSGQSTLDDGLALLETADMMRYRALKHEVSLDGGSQLSEYDWLFKEHFESELRLTQIDTLRS